MITMVRLARRMIRLRVHGLYWWAVATGNGAAADRCRTWLDGDGLYPLERAVKRRAAGTVEKIISRASDESRYTLMPDWPYPCRGCNVAGSKRFLFVCNECGETTCLDCECECYRAEEW